MDNYRGPVSREEWYSNKELYELIMEMSDGLNALNVELKETQRVVKKYNSLRETLGECQLKIQEMENRAQERQRIGLFTREWVGWLIGLLSFLLLLKERGIL